MKKLISNTGGFKTYAEIRECVNPSGLVQFRLLTEFEQSKDPNEHRVLCEILLTEEERQALKEFI